MIQFKANLIDKERYLIEIVISATVSCSIVCAKIDVLAVLSHDYQKGE